MTDPRILRFLDLVQRELAAADARLEIGGQAPADARIVSVELPTGERVVALFDEPPADSNAVQAKLAALAEAFSETLSEQHEHAPHVAPPPLRKMLSGALVELADRANAIESLVIDNASPVLWASGSEATLQLETVPTAARLGYLLQLAQKQGVSMAELLRMETSEMRDRLTGAGMTTLAAGELHRLLGRLREQLAQPALERTMRVARAIAAVRRQDESDHPIAGPASEQQPGFGYLARAFASLYRLMLVFDGDFSQLHAEAALIRALPRIERLVLALPPIDPSPGGGRVVSIRKHPPKKPAR